MLDAIDVLVLDVDGVLTDGRIVYNSAGAEVKRFDVRDGHGVKLWTRTGHRAAVLSGRESAANRRRAEEIGVELVLEGAKDKRPVFEAILEHFGVGPEAVCYVGDDLPDVPVMARVGFAAAPADAMPEARRVAHYVTKEAGGRGAVREVVELILRYQGRWMDVVRRYGDALPDDLPAARHPWRGHA